MKLNKLTAACAVLLCATAANANPRAGMVIDAADINSIASSQEREAAMFFVQKNSDGVLITEENIADIDASKLDVIWLNFDRVGLGKGNFPGIFGKTEVTEALKKFVADGGNLFLTKMATQFVSRIERIQPDYAPGIFGDGDGGEGTDVWTVNAQIGYMNAPDYVEPDPNRVKDETQFYDHRTHPLYDGLTVNNDFAAETFSLLGTGTGAAMWREDHNCMWDLNAYQYTAEGRNTVEKFEAQNNCTVLGTWGHVIDFAVGGIIEFHAPKAAQAREEAAERAGVILANGLAAYEWAPRNGGNAFTANIEKLTENALNYLAKAPKEDPDDPDTPDNPDDPDSGVSSVEAASGVAHWYTISGCEIASDSLIPGIYVVRQGNKARKVIVK